MYTRVSIAPPSPCKHTVIVQIMDGRCGPPLSPSPFQTLPPALSIRVRVVGVESPFGPPAPKQPALPAHLWKLG